MWLVKCCQPDWHCNVPALVVSTSCPTLRSPASIASLEMHGTGTSLGDPIEVGALCEVFCGSLSGDVSER